MDLVIAWRNLWRNPRRTLVILIAVVIGVWSMVFLGALMRGFEADMVRNGINTLTGHIQIHHPDYRNDPVVENSLADVGQLTKTLSAVLPDDALWATRVRVPTVVSNARHSTGITLVGIDPVKEAALSFIGEAVREGEYLDADDASGILVGSSLADKMETRLGRKLILTTQDASGEVVSRAFRISGIYAAEMVSTEKAYVFVDIEAAKAMLGMAGQISEIVIRLPETGAASTVAASLKSAEPLSTLAVETWRELLPILDAYLDISGGFIFIWYLVVFVAMGFGLVNTTLMAVFERMREFGLLKSLGLKPVRIVREVLLESGMLLIMGMAIGNLLGLVSVKPLEENGIDLTAFATGMEFVGFSRVLYPWLRISDVIAANGVVLVLGLTVSLYPALKAARISPVKALAYN